MACLAVKKSQLGGDSLEFHVSTGLQKCVLTVVETVTGYELAASVLCLLLIFVKLESLLLECLESGRHVRRIVRRRIHRAKEVTLRVFVPFHAFSQLAALFAR